jgi:hypothetical protein
MLPAGLRTNIRVGVGAMLRIRFLSEQSASRIEFDKRTRREEDAEAVPETAHARNSGDMF